MKMSNPTLLKLLVATSLIFLVGFLTIWNMTNYRREVIELRKDLTDQMSLATSEYRDSVIQGIFRIIRINENKDGASTRLEINTDGIPDWLNGNTEGGTTRLEMSTDGITRWNNENNIGFSSTIVVADRKDSVVVSVNDVGVHPDTSSSIMFDSKRGRKIIIWNSDIEHDHASIGNKVDTVQGIELMDEIIKDSLQMMDSEDVEHLSIPPPNLYIKIDSFFSNRLAISNLDIGHQVVMKSSIDSSTNETMNIPFGYDDIWSGGGALAIFPNYKGYILKKIWPSLLLSIILLGVVSLSFFAILKSWLAQVKLTKIKNEFISNMTHELKTPISTVGVALEALENFGGIDNPIKRKEYLEISKHEINRLSILVDKVLKMSAFDQTGDTLMTTEIDVKNLTDDMLKSMKLHFEKSKVELSYDVEGDDFVVMGDKVHLTNVFYNLIDNAVKYSKENPKINVSLKSTGRHVLVKISDSGIGISPEYKSKIFDRFFRIPTDDRHNVKGHGLGLHYVYTIIKKHHGSVMVESIEGEGSTFIITIPRAHD